MDKNNEVKEKCCEEKEDLPVSETCCGGSESKESKSSGCCKSD